MNKSHSSCDSSGLGTSKWACTGQKSDNFVLPSLEGEKVKFLVLERVFHKLNGP